MTTEPKTPPAKPVSVPTFEDLKRLIKTMPDEERRKASIELGVQLPRIDDATGKEVRVFGYRCKSCNDIGLEFLGDSWEVWTKKADHLPEEAQSFPYPPTHVPFADLRWVQDGPPKSAMAKLRVTRNRGEPICQHCGNALGRGPEGGIDPKRVIVLAEFRQLKAEDERRKARPMFSYARDAKRAPWPAAGKGKAAEG